MSEHAPLTPAGDEYETERLKRLEKEENLRVRQQLANRLAASREGELLAKILDDIWDGAMIELRRKNAVDTEYQRGRLQAVDEIINGLMLADTILRLRAAREARESDRAAERLQGKKSRMGYPSVDIPGLT